ncbi:hypothetical protein [Streptomyces calidiresistens]
MAGALPEVEDPPTDETAPPDERSSAPGLPGPAELRARAEELGERVAAHFRLLEGR